MLNPIVLRILDLVDSSGLKDKVILEKSNISKSALSEWRKGKATPSTDSVIKLANFFNVSTDYLLTGNDKTSALSDEDIFLLSRFRVLSKEDKEDILCLLETKYNRTQGKKATKASGE